MSDKKNEQTNADEQARALAESIGGSNAPDLLKQAFEVFSQASRQLEASYDELKIKADRLAKELAQTNEELQRQLAEKERIGNFLSNILQSIRSGIIVIAPDGKIAVINYLARQMIAFDDKAEGRPYADVLNDGPIGHFLRECLEAEQHEPRSTDVELSGGGRQVFSLTFAPVLNRHKDEIAALLIMQDVTRLKLLEEQALRTNRLAAMGEMAAQLAHEIRNPLGSVEIFASLLSRDLRGTDNQKLADNIVVGVKSLNSVVTNMLTFTRTINVSPERLNFNELVEETLGFLEQMLAVQDIRLDMRLSEKIGEAEVDPELFKQIILNLAQNSIQAMEDAASPVLTVRTGAVRTESGDAAVEVKISDNGCGIDAEDIGKIFDPFYTTRKGGTGLGLSVVSQIIEKHGGLIIAESTLGKGTTMRLTLPVVRNGN